MVKDFEIEGQLDFFDMMGAYTDDIGATVRVSKPRTRVRNRSNDEVGNIVISSPQPFEGKGDQLEFSLEIRDVKGDEEDTIDKVLVISEPRFAREEPVSEGFNEAQEKLCEEIEATDENSEAYIEEIKKFTENSEAYIDEIRSHTGNSEEVIQENEKFSDSVEAVSKESRTFDESAEITGEDAESESVSTKEAEDINKIKDVPLVSNGKRLRKKKLSSEAAKTEDGNSEKQLFEKCTQCWCFDCKHNSRNEGKPREMCGVMMSCPACKSCIDQDFAEVCVIGSAKEGCRTRAVEEGIASDNYEE